MVSTILNKHCNCANYESPENDLSSDHPPESTYEVFQQVHSLIQSPRSHHVEDYNLHDDILTEETAGLLKIYQNGIGIWMDIFDNKHTYQTEIVSCSLSSPLLMHAICAMSARQMSLTQSRLLWEPVASKFYGSSLNLLIKELTNPTMDGGILLAATILLCSYELLAQPGADYQKHIYGAATLVKSFHTSDTQSQIQQASFWIYARQDVALALVNERPTLTEPVNWPPPNDTDGVDQLFGKKILHYLAQVIDLKFSQSNTNQMSHNTKTRQMRPLLSDIELLWSSLPARVRGTRINRDHKDDEGLSYIWFCDGGAGAGCLYYHMAKILILESLLEEDNASDLTTSMHLHALEIASITLLSDIPDGAMVVTVNPVYYAAKHIPSLALKTRLWGVLDKIETRLGFYTRDRQIQVHYELKKRFPN